jgi:hypothetical protein
MKKFTILSCILTVTLLLVILLTGCQQESVPSQPSKLPTVEIQGNAKVYINSKFNFSFNLCNNNDFELTENYKGTTVALLGPLLKDLKHQIGIFVAPGKLSNNTKLEDYLKNLMKDAGNSLAKFAITNESTVTISGISAKLISFTYTVPIEDEEWLFKTTLVVFNKDNLVYIIKYEAPDEFYEQYADCFNLLISTLKFR